MTLRIGVVSNPRSRRNRRRGGLEPVRAVLARHPGVLHAEPDDVRAVPAVLAEFARREVGLVVANGGDGTVHAILTALFNGAPFGERPPALAVLPAGGANLIAADVGLRGRPDRALARLLDLAPDGIGGLARMTRPVLAASGLGPDLRPAYGMFFGTAAFYEGTRIAHDVLHPWGIGEPLATVVAIGLCIARALPLRPGASNPVRRGEPMAIAVDGRRQPERHYTLFVATTLRHLMLGLMPFWGADGRIRYTWIEAPPRRLARALLPALRGRPRPWMAACGYVSGAADGLSLWTAGRMVLDGEILAPTKRGEPVVIEGARDVAFVRC